MSETVAESTEAADVGQGGGSCGDTARPASVSFEDFNAERLLRAQWECKATEANDRANLLHARLAEEVGKRWWQTLRRERPLDALGAFAGVVLVGCFAVLAAAAWWHLWHIAT